MSNQNTIFHNELIGLISIMSILRYQKKISLGKSMLIYPFYAHKNTLNVLKRKNIKIRSIEELIVKYPSNFSNFNERFYSLLPVTINSIIILNRMKLINIRNGYLYLNEENSFDLMNDGLGKRVKDIVQASEKLNDILKEDTKNLYVQLRVRL
ncbi:MULTISPECIES: three component ABC system middle component [Bacillus cereus group]|uniref:Uncharacterized protein n=2 Tax=Bacillus cereus group TaxID=86661 RepID=A0A9X6WH95_BACTU|nr:MULTISPECIES: three component ABC system middle component [Bacillus cereus group]AZV64354.1 hypothetical protein DT426_01010 [Bacillus cereus]MBR9664139.1 hypothetical protein [Bacillus cereus]MDA2101851.1 DUF6521 family protein [Bacillus cereus]MDA2107454.1 DUF6521 family protein [Bacillus cereus]MDA2342609.1 DUF6521 family protein [Bacillus cereus]